MGTIYIDFEDEYIIRSLGNRFKQAPKNIIKYIFKYIDRDSFEKFIADELENG